jgi:RES domain-containing protein
LSSERRLGGVSAVSVRGRFWRMLSPRWAFRPLSGDGAALRGGRWNALGQPALSLSENHGVAVAEYMQGLVRPGLLTPYDVASDQILDLADPALRVAAVVDQDLLRLNWREIRDIGRGRP